MLITITTMLSHSLIFLCLGVYACCMPLETLTDISEIQIRLELIQKEGNVIPINANMTSVDIPDEITKKCANYNLDKFIEALNLMNIEGPPDVVKNYQILLKSLKKIAERPDVKFQENNPCNTVKTSTHELLEELAGFLREVHGYLGSNKAR